MDIQIRSLADAGSAEVFTRTEDSAFGVPFDEKVSRAFWSVAEPDRSFIAWVDGEPVGTSAALSLDLTLPGGSVVPVAGVSAVGVAPSHRRAGVFSQLMRNQLAQAYDRGDAAAVLHASDAAIYGRVGFGEATRRRHLAARSREVSFRPDRPRAEGSFRMLDRDTAGAVMADVHERARRSVTGGLSRPSTWWPLITGTTELYLGGGERRMFMAHLDETGRADGYVVYEVADRSDGPTAQDRLTVWELVGESAAVEVELWAVLFGQDLIEIIDAFAPVDGALFDVVVDERQLRCDWEQDLLWLRPLHVEELLSRRVYATRGSLAIEVTDALGFAAGVFLLESDAAGVACTRTDDVPGISVDPDVSLDVAELGRLVLGGGSARRAARAGRLTELRHGAAAAVDAMFATDPLPWCWVRF